MQRMADVVTDKFLADVHLGKLARHLRLLGYDTCYHQGWTPRELARMGVEENRILLSRSLHFLKMPQLRSFLILEEDPFLQLVQVVRYFQLLRSMHPFSRCLACNGSLLSAQKSSVMAKLQPDTIAHYEDFWQCEGCNKVYWKGPHYQRMLTLIEKLRQAVMRPEISHD